MLPAAMCWANALLRARVSLPCLGPPSAQPSETNLLVPGYALSTALKETAGAFLVAQRLGVSLPMQGIWV